MIDLIIIIMAGIVLLFLLSCCFMVARLLSFMLLISSRFENMWIPLGIGVAGFLSGMALANSDLAILMFHPFVVMLKPAVAMSAQPDKSIALVALTETVLFLAISFGLANYTHYE